jgi:tetratricopeptide (TPR) repeat protein
VALDPDNGAYIDSLGWAHYQLGEYDEARRYLERAAGLVPRDATVVEHLGDLYQALGEVERARDLYRRALDLAGLDGENAEQLRRKLARLEGGSR